MKIFLEMFRTLLTVIVGGLIVGRGWKTFENHKLGGGHNNWGGWKSLTKKFEFTQNLHEFERIRAILYGTSQR